MLTRLKQKVQQALAAEARAAHRIGLTPNIITGIGILLAFLSALAYAEWGQNSAWHNRMLFLVLAFVLLLLSGFCDALDGIVARLYGQATVFGGFLDSVLDRYADAAVYLGIIVGGLCNVLWGIVAMIGSLLVSYSRARAEAAGIKMESVGLAERAERMIILLVATLTAVFWQPITVMSIGVILLAILSNLTVLQRGLYVYQKTKKKETV
jgi:archaetidylinositol phosphate synthase